MDAKLKTKWVKALRSGKYRPTTAQLRSGRKNAFCCLGVLADIQGCSWTKDGEPKKNGERVDYTHGGCYLTTKFAGLTQRLQRRLGNLNDIGKSFPEIADYIEKRL